MGSFNCLKRLRSCLAYPTHLVHRQILLPIFTRHSGQPQNRNIFHLQKVPLWRDNRAHHFLCVTNFISTRDNNYLVPQSYHIFSNHRVSYAALSCNHCLQTHQTFLSGSPVCTHLMRTLHVKVIHLWTSKPESSTASHLCSRAEFQTTARFYRGQVRNQDVNRRNNQSSQKNDDSDEADFVNSRSPPRRSLRQQDGDHLTGWDGDEGEKGLARLWDDERNHAENLDSEMDLVRNWDSDDKEHTEITVRRKPADEITLPELSRVSFNLVPFVKRSVTLQNLVRLGVDLSKVQRVKEVAELLVRSDFERDIFPYLKFLVLVGVDEMKIGYIFSNNPLLFKESVKDLDIRIGYLLHNNFGLREVAAMISKAPVILLMDPIKLEEKFGFLQNVFNLTAHEAREVAKLCPRILPWKKELLADVKFHVKEFIGFTDPEIKQLILKDPKIFMSGKNTLVDRFDYLYNHMMIPHSQILVWPNILRVRLFVVKNRHLFLLHLGRAQYDPCQENFISLRVLGSVSDEEFCQRAAKCSVQEFYDFCKTL